jgi:uncharacterized membrane protein YkvA (DUF1232 family)
MGPHKRVRGVQASRNGDCKPEARGVKSMRSGGPAVSYNCPVLRELRARASALKNETHAIYLAALDARTPWFARALVLLVVAYALSPVDLIPDFIPVLGYLDDAIIIPAGIALSLRLIPEEVMAEARERARTEPVSRGLRVAGAAIIVMAWILAIIAVVSFIRAWWRTR